MTSLPSGGTLKYLPREVYYPVWKKGYENPMNWQQLVLDFMQFLPPFSHLPDVVILFKCFEPSLH